MKHELTMPVAADLTNRLPDLQRVVITLDDLRRLIAAADLAVELAPDMLDRAEQADDMEMFEQLIDAGVIDDDGGRCEDLQVLIASLSSAPTLPKVVWDGLPASVEAGAAG